MEYVSKINIFGLKMMVKGLDFFYFEIERAPSSLLLTGQANSAFMADVFVLGRNNSKMVISLQEFHNYRMSSSWCDFMVL